MGEALAEPTTLQLNTLTLQSLSSLSSWARNLHYNLRGRLELGLAVNKEHLALDHVTKNIPHRITKNKWLVCFLPECLSAAEPCAAN